jgi:hypothetical protein
MVNVCIFAMFVCRQERDSAEVEVIDVNMVVQVEEKRGQVTRCIYSPLE